MVVSQFDAREGLPGLNIASVRDRFGALTLSLVRGGEEKLNPHGDEVIHAGDVLTLQASYPEYRRVRAFTRESEPPTWSHYSPTDVPGQRKTG